MSDIVERLRERAASGVNCLCGNPVCDEAAEEILRLRAENEKLRAALKPCVDYFSWNGGLIRDEEYEAAAAALEGVTEPASPWRDIESAPRDGTHIDLWVNGERIPDARWNDRQRRWEVWSLGDYDGMEFVSIAGNPTHWMPLPKPPR